MVVCGLLRSTRVQNSCGVPNYARIQFPWEKIVIKGRENIFLWWKLDTQVEGVAKMGAGSPVNDLGRSRLEGSAKTL